MLVWTSALGLVAIKRRAGVGRVLGAVACMPPALFCVYGLVASQEPGVGRAWTVGYGLSALLFLAVAALLNPES